MYKQNRSQDRDKRDKIGVKKQTNIHVYGFIHSCASQWAIMEPSLKEDRLGVLTANSKEFYDWNSNLYDTILK